MVIGIGAVLKAISAAAFDRGPRDDDTVDRLNHMVMYGLLVFLALAAGTRQYVGTAIYCWTPAQYFEKHHRRYVNHYCWVNTMYSIPFEETIPKAEDERYSNDVSFYRLATAFFLALAIMFRVPQILWKKMQLVSGAKVEQLVGLTTDTVLMDQDKRDKQLGHVAEYFHRWVSSSYLPDRSVPAPWLLATLANIFLFRRNCCGNNLIFIYLFIKLLYLLNVIGQFYIISAFLKTNYWTFGVTAVTSYIKNGQWEDEYDFPRVAFCDFKLRNIQNVQTYTVQCVLAINLFLEKMFLLLWFCLVLMLFANSVSFIKWTVQLLIEPIRTRFLVKYLTEMYPGRSATSDNKRKKLVVKLVKYLKWDGVFVIRMISVNSTDMLTLDLVRQIWIKYKKSRDVYVATPIVAHAKMNGEVHFPQHNGGFGAWEMKNGLAEESKGEGYH